MPVKIVLPVLALLLLATSLIHAGCRKKENNEPGDNDSTATGKAQVWLTRGDKAKLFSHELDLDIEHTASAIFPIIEVDTSTRYQSVEGYGAALTGSSAYLINKQLDATARQRLLLDLFSPESGIGISYLRLTMGASDFSLSDYTYDDLPAGSTDFSLQQFSLGRDMEDVVPVMKEILQVAPGIQLMATPWSPPAWMKTNGSLKGGQLKTDCYEVYADYFIQYIQEMKENGISIAAVTPQNEPLFGTAAYPCMEMQPAEQAAFIKNALGPKFRGEGIASKIVIYDHNWDNANYAISVLNDAEAAQYIAGSAFHAYAGDVSAMNVVHQAHPGKDLYFTEISGGNWATDFASNLMWNMRNIFIGTALNWSKTALLWNLALDQESGPKNKGCGDCRGVITINTTTKTIKKNEEYYSIAHFSKFVRNGATRVNTVLPPALTNMGAVAFQNTDGSKVLVAANYSNDFKTFSLNQGRNNFAFSLAAQSVVTLIWQ